MKTVLFFVVLISFCFSSLAQTAPTATKEEKEKAQKELEKRLLDILNQSAEDAAALKLARNRAVVYGITGDLFWAFDEKRARELFRNAENELIAANAEDDKEKKDSDDLYAGIYEFESIRSDLLPLVARHDADLALAMLVSTRPAKIAEAMAKAAQPNVKSDSGFLNFNPDQFRVQQEIALEQRFAVLAAEQNPDKAIKIFRDSLARGISPGAIGLLQKINKKDEKKAAGLADELVRRIAETDLTKKRDELGAAISFLEYATAPAETKNAKEKPFKFSETQTRDIANKLAATFLQPAASLDLNMAMTRLMSTLEKVVPEKMPALRQQQAEMSKNLPPDLKNFQSMMTLWSPNTTPEEILAELPKLGEAQRPMLYTSLADKIAKIDDEARARKLLDQIPDEKARAQATEKYESGRINRAAADGKLDDARKLIKNLSQKTTQVQQFVALAVRFYKKNTEADRETAAALMKDARALVNEYPEDESELNDLMEVVRGYATVDPPEAFRLFEPIVDQISDFVQAAAILSKYNKRSQTFKKGELVFKVNGYSWDSLLLFRYTSQIQLLGKADLFKMSAYADKFQRTDARTIFRLFIAQGYLKDDKADDESGPTFFGGDDF
ncbi:MAG: hypothetical protein JSS81_12480 [Acidobacteria bacterium]|nr:hypothetical protein [Acidobacteriota bacterium]